MNKFFSASVAFFAMAVALTVVGASPARASDGMPTQSQCDSGSTTYTWTGLGIARPVIASMIVDGETIPDPTNPADGSIGAVVCPNVDLARKTGLTVYRRSGSEGHIDLTGAVTPAGNPITSSSVITITLTNMGDLARYYSFSLVHGVVSTWTTANLGTSSASLTVALSPSRTPLVSGSGDSEFCSATPPNCHAAKSDSDVLSASLDMDFDQAGSFSTFTGAYFGLTGAVAGFVQASTASDGTRSLSATLGAPHALADGTTANTGSMQAFLPDSVLSSMFGLSSGSIDAATLAVSRTESTSTSFVPFTVEVVTGGVIVKISDITFSSPVYKIKKSTLTTECRLKGCIVTIPGPQQSSSAVHVGPLVKVFSAAGKALTKYGEFYAFNKNYNGGGYIATGDIDEDGADEIVVGEGAGKDIGNTGAQRIRVFEKNGTRKSIELAPFDKNYAGGLSVAVGDTDGDGKAKEIATCEAAGGRTECKVYRYNTAKQMLAYWRPFGATTAGATIALADVDNDGRDEAIVATGSGATAQVRVYDIGSKTITAINKGATLKPITLSPFGTYRGGVSVTGGDVDGDGKAEISVGQSGLKQEPRVKTYRYNSARTLLSNFFPFVRSSKVGANVALRDITADGKAELLVGTSLTGGAQIRSFNATTTKAGSLNFFPYNKTFRGGVRFDVAKF